MQHALRDAPALDRYKLGMVEALIKQTLRLINDDESIEVVRANLRTALDVAVWEPPRRRSG